MSIFGSSLIIAAFVAAIAGAIISAYSAFKLQKLANAAEVEAYGAGGVLGVGRRLIYLVATLCTISFLLIEISFVKLDLSLDIVSGHASHTTPLFYRLGSPWSSQEGSLLLWAWLLSLWSTFALARLNGSMIRVAAWAQVVLLAIMAFFLALLVFWTPPFAQTLPAPYDGVGLSPSLQYPSMMIHPPMLYLGYTLFTIPFAFAIGALISGDLDEAWLAVIRRFAVAAWLMLGIGIVLGARWSYAELGWGGYWGWDPVENASLMPWLSGTAFIHSIMIWQRRGMLKTWSLALILATGILCVMGTFIVRSGIFGSSIHAFGASTVGTQLLLLVMTQTCLAVGLLAYRSNLLRSEHKIESLLSREAFFLAANVVLSLLAALVMWGTFFPLFAELITGNQRPLKPETWGLYVGPLSLVVVGLTAAGPLLAWRRSTKENLKRQLRVPLLISAICAVFALVISQIFHGPVKIGFLLAAAGSGLVFGAVFQELLKATKWKKEALAVSYPKAFVALLASNRRRYGGYIVHLGFATLALGVAGSTAFKDTQRAHGNVGTTFSSGGYELKYRSAIGTYKLQEDGRLQKLILGANVDVYKGGKLIDTLTPTREYRASSDLSMGAVSRYFNGENTTEIALRSGIFKDLWLAIQPDGDAINAVAKALDGKVSKKSVKRAALTAIRFTKLYEKAPADVELVAIASPIVSWIWIGTLLIGIGGLVAISPGGNRRTQSELKNQGRASAIAESHRLLLQQMNDAKLDGAVGKFDLAEGERQQQLLSNQAAALSDQYFALTGDRLLDNDATGKV